jgi:transcriptional regulator with XRE-family HTH domain
LTLYVRELIEAWLEAHDETARGLAKLAGVTDTAISDVRKERAKRGIGRDLLIELAGAMGYKVDTIVAASRQWTVGTPVTLPPSSRGCPA